MLAETFPMVVAIEALAHLGLALRLWTTQMYQTLLCSPVPHLRAPLIIRQLGALAEIQ